MRSSRRQGISRTSSATRHFFRFFALLTPALLLAAGGTPVDRALCTLAFFQIVSPDAQTVTPNRCRAVAQQVMAAWNFDANRMQWADGVELEAPLTMRLLSIGRMKAEHPGVLGFARGRDLFVVSEAVLEDPFANGTLAHELAHIQAKRALGQQSEEHLVPRYFIEGHGNWLGRAYRDYLRVAKHDYDIRKARQMMRFTADDASTILTDDSYGVGDHAAEDQMESMGIFFVEYLRVRHHQTGIPDTVPRMGRVFEMVGRGSTYEHAFREVFGTSVDRVVSEIVSFIGRTASRPAERLIGTRYAEFR